jgi:hypothetical protein
MATVSRSQRITTHLPPTAAAPRVPPAAFSTSAGAGAGRLHVPWGLREARMPLHRATRHTLLRSHPDGSTPELRATEPLPRLRARRVVRA